MRDSFHPSPTDGDSTPSESNQWWRQLADTLPQVIWTNRSDGTADYFNQRWFEYTGLTLAESVGPGWEAVVHPDDKSASVSRWHESFANGRAFDCEYRLRRRDGVYRWFIGRNMPLHDDQGTVTGWFGTATDIDDLKQAQAVAREREEQFRHAIEEAPFPVIMQAEEGGVIATSRTWRKLTGFDPTSMSGHEGWPAVAYGEGAEAVSEQLRHVFTENTRVDAVEFTVTQNGEQRHWLFSVSPPGTHGDGRRFVVGMVLDLTEHKRTEAALAASREWLRLIVDSAHEHAILSADLERRVTSWNTGAERMTGYAKDEMIGQMVDLIFTPEDRAAGAPVQEMTAALAKGHAADERWHQRKNGTRFWGSGAMLPMRGGPGGEVIGLVKSFRDESEKQQAREALEVSRAALQSALATTERTRAEAEAATKAKDYFISVLSHELRTPLTPVLLAAHTLARRHDLPEAVREALAMIRTNVQLEAHLVDDLLDVTRIASGKMELIRGPVDVHACIRQAADVCRSEFEAKQQRLQLKLDATAHELEGDDTRLQQVCWNLLKNASKFTPSGGEISLTTVNDGDHLIVNVTDTGIGLDAEEITRIFDAFTQASPAITREFGGLGLGLAISRAAVVAHQGDLHAVSPGPGKGATFTIVLPLNKTHLSPAR